MHILSCFTLFDVDIKKNFHRYFFDNHLAVSCLADSIYDADDDADDANGNDDDAADDDNLMFQITCSVILPRAAGLNSSRASHHRGISY